MLIDESNCVFVSSTKRRLEQSTWEMVCLGQVTRPEEVKLVKRWLKDNACGEYVLKYIKETKGTRRFTIATLIRFKEDTDAMMFKLAWYDHQ